MSYGYYSLLNTRETCTHDSTTCLQKTLKNIELTIRDHKFSGENPILVFDFLTRIVEGADTLGMSEGQLIVFYPHLLTKNAAQRYRSSSNNSRPGSILCSPEAAQYIHRTYATEKDTREAVEHFENLREASNEHENAFVSIVSGDPYGFENVHTEVEKFTIFINGLFPAIRPVFSRFRGEHTGY